MLFRKLTSKCANLVVFTSCLWCEILAQICTRVLSKFPLHFSNLSKEGALKKGQEALAMISNPDKNITPVAKETPTLSVILFRKAAFMIILLMQF